MIVDVAAVPGKRRSAHKARVCRSFSEQRVRFYEEFAEGLRFLREYPDVQHAANREDQCIAEVRNACRVCVVREDVTGRPWSGLARDLRSLQPAR